MSDGLLPLFPLELVLFPRTMLPLHIFEDRYKEMIGLCLERRSEFGLVQAGEKGIVNSGCAATVERVIKTYPDGRMDILAVGRRRFEIVMLNDELKYLRGSVQFFDDEDPDPVSEEMRARALEIYADWADQDPERELPELDPSEQQISFQIAQAVSDLEFRQILLATRSETERLRQVVEFLPGYLGRQRLAARVRELAPRNGHSKTPPGLA